MEGCGEEWRGVVRSGGAWRGVEGCLQGREGTVSLAYIVHNSLNNVKVLNKVGYLTDTYVY